MMVLVVIVTIPILGFSGHLTSVSSELFTQICLDHIRARVQGCCGAGRPG